MHSMTGYGRGQAMSKGTKVTAEIQSVNKRQTEILINLPSALTSLENDLRAKIDRSLHRGRIIVTISASGPSARASIGVGGRWINVVRVKPELVVNLAFLGIA